MVHMVYTVVAIYVLLRSIGAFSHIRVLRPVQKHYTLCMGTLTI